MIEKQTVRQSEWSLSPVSKPDAAERSGSISADEQTQVAVWKPETTERELAARWRKPEGINTQTIKGEKTQSWMTEWELSPKMVQELQTPSSPLLNINNMQSN